MQDVSNPKSTTKQTARFPPAALSKHNSLLPWCAVRFVYDLWDGFILSSLASLSKLMTWADACHCLEVEGCLHLTHHFDAGNGLGTSPSQPAKPRPLLSVCREGEEWQKIRSILGKHMLKPKEVESYTGTLNDVVSDLVRRLERQRNLHEQHVVKNVADEFYKFGLEGTSLGDWHVGTGGHGVAYRVQMLQPRAKYPIALNSLLFRLYRVVTTACSLQGVLFELLCHSPDNAPAPKPRRAVSSDADFLSSRSK